MPEPDGANDPHTSLLRKAYEQLEKVIDDIVVLRVTTVIGTVTADNVTDPLQRTQITVDPAGQLVAYSAVNTALGDANVVFSKGFVDDATLMSLHNQALQQSREIRKDSLDMLRSAIGSILGTPAAPPSGS